MVDSSIVLIIGVIFLFGSLIFISYDVSIEEAFRECELLSSEGYDTKVVWHRQVIFGDNQCWVKFGDKYIPKEKWLVVKEVKG